MRCSSGYRNQYSQNELVDILTTEAEDVTEPVTLDEVKAHLAITFDDDDNLLTGMIKSSRQAMERFTAVSLVARTVQAILHVSGRMELPYGPVVAITASLDSNGETLDIADTTTYGLGFKSVGYGYHDLTYTAGYEVIPADLKRAILEDVAWHYEHRGDSDYEGGAMSLQAMATARPHRRVPKVL